MSLRNTILRGVDTAFRIADGLATDVTFNPAQSSGYNFSNQSATVASSGSVTIRGIITTVDEASITDGSKAGSKLLIKASDISESIDNYSTFSIDNKIYALDKYEDNGYVIEISLRS